MIQSFPSKSLITSNVMMNTVQLLPVLSLRRLNMSHSVRVMLPVTGLFIVHTPMHKLGATIVRLECLIGMSAASPTLVDKTKICLYIYIFIYIYMVRAYSVYIYILPHLCAMQYFHIA